jgi:hypothetical protein
MLETFLYLDRKNEHFTYITNTQDCAFDNVHRIVAPI